MTFKRTVLWSSLGWLALITGLHAWLNLDVFSAKKASAQGLKIGYLPVT